MRITTDTTDTFAAALQTAVLALATAGFTAGAYSRHETETGGCVVVTSAEMNGAPSATCAPAATAVAEWHDYETAMLSTVGAR